MKFIIQPPGTLQNLIEPVPPSTVSMQKMTSKSPALGLSVHGENKGFTGSSVPVCYHSEKYKMQVTIDIEYYAGEATHPRWLQLE
jgi:hypothetical protein